MQIVRHFVAEDMRHVKGLLIGVIQTAIIDTVVKAPLAHKVKAVVLSLRVIQISRHSRFPDCLAMLCRDVQVIAHEFIALSGKIHCCLGALRLNP